jgi:uncharacterized protein (TIGR03546 family)
MTPLHLIAKIIKILSSEESPNQIAFGFAMGMIIGLTPFWTLHNIVLIVLLIVLRVNIASALFSMAIFSGFAYLFDTLFHNFGYYLLVDAESLHGIWTSLYNFPIIALSHYNNTVVMGSFISALILFIPLYFAIKYFVIAYRTHLYEKFQKLKIVKAVKASKLYTIYGKLKGLGE